MTIHFKLIPVIAIAAGIAVLVLPARIMPIIVGTLLIAYGVISLIR